MPLNIRQWSIPIRVQRVVTQLNIGGMPSYLWVNVETIEDAVAMLCESLKCGGELQL
jgi:hypothetical protein